ncbi:NAD(P)H-dependent oxidoreductase [Flavobacterium branchiarum]|uniref:NAD(P)H-dependent oxidoreductase n=1 Tax=Flavobacterium branchiarum TaxID=1114870 RepID=A0ABV5FQE5_9FLAO|nr:NAD(P)H-dependent oxidoreductase [Flavobacterium branchiarum]MDN3673275.1 NAD(P)H-dependent oxidoreductase [Flavobacterium branchiarum]
MQKIVVINGHPDENSFNCVIAHSYMKSALEVGSEVRYVAIGELDFNPNLQFGYKQRMELEPDLVKALDDIKWASHQVWIHPLWWLGMPAIMKGFFDRAFLPGITFKSNKGYKSEGLLNNKTGRIITTAGDLSETDYESIYKSSGLVQLKNGILEYCGVSSIQTNFIGPIYELDESDINEWIEKIEDFARIDSVTEQF